ncbi:hypothetical protein [Streptomyces sp. NPDC048551]
MATTTDSTKPGGTAMPKTARTQHEGPDAGADGDGAVIGWD